MEIARSVPARRSLALAGLVALTVSAQAAFGKAAPTATSLEGVWRVTKVVTTGPNAATESPNSDKQTIYTHVR